MKRQMWMLLVVLLLITGLSSCGDEQVAEEEAATSRPQVVKTQEPTEEKTAAIMPELVVKPRIVDDTLAFAAALARYWTSSNGKFSVVAELVEVKGDSVRLKKKDGKIITVPLAKLSKADRDFLAAKAKAKKKPEATKPTPEEVIAAIKKLGGRVTVIENKIVFVNLSGTQVTDAGLEHLKGLTNLRRLYLSGTKVTDAGLEHLKGLTNLEHLSLSSTKVTDAGLEHLKGLTKLRALALKGTQVTNVGVKKLQQALPNCKIYR